MGANAQTSVPTFTAGQVLTAQQLNDSARTGVPVAADSAARDGLFGGTGEKTLAEGQLVYLEDSNIVQYYDGSNWQTLGPASAGGLVRITGETSFSAASSVTFDTAFSSTYRNYKLILNYTTSTTNDVLCRLRASGSSVSTSTYNWQRNVSDANSITTSRSVDQSAFQVAIQTNGAFNSTSEITFYGPNVATPTIYSTIIVNNRNPYNGTGSGQGTILYFHGGNQTDSTQFTGFEILVSTGTITGTYTLYGMATS